MSQARAGLFQSSRQVAHGLFRLRRDITLGDLAGLYTDLELWSRVVATLARATDSTGAIMPPIYATSTYVQESPTDLMVLDMIMDPGINCLETYERVIKIHPGQKSVIVSGYAETEDVKEAQRLGAGKYIKKPLTLQKLGPAIKEELSRS